MGCACVYPKQQGDYITFPTRGAKSEREDNPLSKGAIKIQSSFRSMKTRSQLKSERENFINKYNDQLNNDINISMHVFKTLKSVKSISKSINP